MKIVFVTTQSPQGSTVIGRVLPLAEEFAKKHEVCVLGHGSLSAGGERAGVRWKNTGKDPFLKTPRGKKRLSGVRLIFRLKWNAIQSATKLIFLKPDVVIIVKSLPENVLAAWLATRLIRPKRIILDVDDFELTANVTVSLIQRAVIHWAERTGAKMADQIVTATPFLSDHFEQLTQGRKKSTMIPTGLTPHPHPFSSSEEKGAKLVYAGSLTLSSGHRIDLLPEILKLVRQQYPDIQLHVYGTGDDAKILKQEGIILHGRFSPPYKGGVPSLWRGEGVIFLDPIDNSITARSKSSFRVALAAALGLPVVTSDIGIRPYLVPAALHHRFFAKPADAADYASKVLALLESPLAPVQQASLHQHAQQFTWVRLAEKYAKIITSA